MAAVTIHSDFVAQEEKICHCFYFFPFYLPWSDGTSSHVRMWELDRKEGWVPKKGCFWIVVLKKTLESPLDCLHGDQTSQSLRKSTLNIHWKDWYWSWNSHTLATWWEVLTLIKDPDSGKDWGQEEKETTKDEMAGWHLRLNGLEFEWTLGVGNGQGGLACCDSWGRKELDTTERLNWTDGTRCHDLTFFNVEFQASFFTLLFHLHQEDV